MLRIDKEADLSLLLKFASSESVSNSHCDDDIGDGHLFFC